METNPGNLLLEAADEMGLVLNNREMNMFSIYYRELMLWNRKINLVSTKSSLDIPIKHFIDSLTPIPFLKNTNARLLDIGSGAGFPGLPLKIMMPDLSVYLLESSRKKSSFLKHIIRTLDLRDIGVIHNRVEYVMQGDSYRERFDIVISRAAFKLPDLVRKGAFFLAEDGLIIAMKGKSIAAELTDAVQIPGISLGSCHNISLPITGDFRKILLFHKET